MSSGSQGQARLAKASRVVVSRCMLQRLLGVVAAAGALCLTSGCTEVLGQSAYAANTGGAAPAAGVGLPSADGGCTPTYPVRLINYGIGAEYFIACTDPYRSSVEVTNVSQGVVLSASSNSWTMLVWPPAPRSPLTPNRPSPPRFPPTALNLPPGHADSYPGRGCRSTTQHRRTS